jgi:hypothetical protein
MPPDAAPIRSRKRGVFGLQKLDLFTTRGGGSKPQPEEVVEGCLCFDGWPYPARRSSGRDPPCFHAEEPNVDRVVADAEQVRELEQEIHAKPEHGIDDHVTGLN